MRRNLCIILLLVVSGIARPGIGQESARDQLKRAISLEQTGVLMEAVATYDAYLKENPDDVVARARLIGLLVRMEEKMRAIPHISILRRLEPNNPNYIQYYAIEDDFRLNVEAAQEKDYAKRIKSGEKTPSTFLEYSKFLYARGDEAGSLEMLKRYVAVKPDDFAARLDLARRLSWKKNVTDARQHAQAAVNLQPNSVEANLLLGDLCWWQGDEDGALAAYRRAANANPNSAEAKRKISKIVDAPGYREKKMIESLKKEPDTKVAIELARYYLDQGREWEADSLVKRRLAVEPEDKDAIKLADEIEKQKQEKYTRQIKTYKARLAAAPNDTTVMLALARYYTSVPNLDSAIMIFDRYMKHYPLDYQVRMERARAMMWNARSAEASAEFRVISVAQPENHEASLNLAECLVMNDTDLEEAEGIFKRELTAWPDSIRIRVGYADVLRRQGRYEEARPQYSAILAVEPDNERAKFGLGVIERDISPLIHRMEKQVEEHPEDNASRRRLAGLYYDTKRFWDAEVQVTILLKSKPNDKQLQAFLNEIKNRSKAIHSAALDSLQREVTAHPEDSPQRRRLADQLAEATRYDEAMYHYNLLLLQSPEDNNLKMKVVEILLAAGKTKEAAALLREVADDNPGNFGIRFRLAQIFSWIPDYDAAITEYEAAMRLDPQSVECQLALADISRWRGDPYTAYDVYSRVLASNPKNETAQKAVNELKGTFFRGAQVSLQQSEDSELFKQSESRAIVSINLSLRMRMQTGLGKVHFEQSDALNADLYAETGWFFFGNLDYRIDPLTRAAGQLKLYNFAQHKSRGLRLEIEHIFDDISNLNGMTGTAYYTTQEAVLDLASTHNLVAWTDRLHSERLGVNVKYNYSPAWNGDGELALIAVSDGNTRTDFWGEWRRAISKLLQLGIRYESVSAKKIAPQYWSPKNYQTLSLVAILQNNLNRWSYKIHGGVGRVLSTNDALRNFSAEIQWRVAQSVYFSGGLLDMTTTRADGQYHYRGLSLALTMER